MISSVEAFTYFLYQNNSHVYLSFLVVRGARPKLSRLHATFRFKIETPQGENMTAAEFRIYKEQKFNKLRIPILNVTYRVELHQDCFSLP